MPTLPVSLPAGFPPRCRAGAAGHTLPSRSGSCARPVSGLSPSHFGSCPPPVPGPVPLLFRVLSPSHSGSCSAPFPGLSPSPGCCSLPVLAREVRFGTAGHGNTHGKATQEQHSSVSRGPAYTTGICLLASAFEGHPGELKAEEQNVSFWVVARVPGQREER